MSTTKLKNLESKLLEFFRDMANAKESNNFEYDKEKFLFHMTDWNSSLESLARLYSNPEDFSQEDASRVLREFFYHVLPHLNAAAEIYDDAAELYKMHCKSKPT
jgi:hypothetical protein